jgi:hypothetical protein
MLAGRPKRWPNGHQFHPMNSRAKGQRGERAWCDQLHARGYDARRGFGQHVGGCIEPDVVCGELDGLHFEVKVGARPNIDAAMVQARRDARAGRRPVVVSKRDRGDWLVTVDAETFFDALEGKIRGTRVASRIAEAGGSC